MGWPRVWPESSAALICTFHFSVRELTGRIKSLSGILFKNCSIIFFVCKFIIPFWKLYFLTFFVYLLAWKTELYFFIFKPKQPICLRNVFLLNKLLNCGHRYVCTCMSCRSCLELCRNLDGIFRTAPWLSLLQSNGFHWLQSYGTGFSLPDYCVICLLLCNISAIEFIQV